MVSVTFLPNNITISVEAGTTVLEAMIQAGLKERNNGFVIVE